ncbi:hypothetical protein CKAH01_15870 [Colletotrichum kahawae]|uniref:Uncharacterized protein n=1 Tax=Colletotrichum kahawae TaxID=34407 RepID=A0AAD9YFZ0_COLKA|nr:hypothetical protein CKAH01_15870 [Colletotrichum kahawae]
MRLKEAGIQLKTRIQNGALASIVYWGIPNCTADFFWGSRYCISRAECLFDIVRARRLFDGGGIVPSGEFNHR